MIGTGILIALQFAPELRMAAAVEFLVVNFSISFRSDILLLRIMYCLRFERFSLILPMQQL